MTDIKQIVELGRWFATPLGRYLVQWEQDCLDHAVTDAFGYHALQLGLPEIDALRANRMPHRWVASDSLADHERLQMPEPEDHSITTRSPEDPLSLRCEFDALPFPDHSIDLAVLPHTLEMARDPHLTLSEVERVLVPEGRVVIVCLNPASLWGVRQRLGASRRTEAASRDPSNFLPRTGALMGYRRLRDWLRLLGFEVEAARFGCWRPPLRSPAWLDRFAWADAVGKTWWPVLGAVYCVQAVKRVRGMRLVGLSRAEVRHARAPRPAVARRDGAAMSSVPPEKGLR